MTEIKFEARPQSPRGNKTAHGGGLSFVMDMDEGQFEAWAKIAALRGQNLTWTATLAAHQPDYPRES